MGGKKLGVGWLYNKYYFIDDMIHLSIRKEKYKKKYYVKKGPNCKRRKNTCKIFMN